MNSLRFVVGERYANNIGSYTVLELDRSKMLVRYDDGQESMLGLDTQWNIVKRRQREADERAHLLKKQANDEVERVRLVEAARKANIEDGWFREIHSEPEHMGRCSATGTCPKCIGMRPK